MTDKEFMEIANSIHFGGVAKQYKEHSHQKIDDIKRMQKKHAKDLIQPREGGEVNEAFVKEYGTKNLNISEHDIKQAEKKHFRSKTLQKLNKRYNENNNS